MNRYLANYLFGNETLFYSQKDKTEDTKKSGNIKIEPEKPILTAQKPILVLVKDLKESQKDFLNKILASVNIQEANYHIMDVNIDLNVHLSESCHKIIIFGNEAQILGFTNINKYQPTFQENKKILLADSLLQIEQNASDEKRKLWNALKLLV
jgi:hypothetical protein